MKSIVKNCEHCNEEFNVLTKEIKRGNGKFCSMDCSHKGRKRQVRKLRLFTCSWCHKDFCSAKKTYSKSGLRFCNRECKELAQKIGGIKEIQPSHYGITLKNYRKIAFKEFPNECNRCGYNKIVGILEVHHKDRNRGNCKIENLEILCPTCHFEEHYNNKDGKWGRS